MLLMPFPVCPRKLTTGRQLGNVSEFLEFFYDEETETSILQCLPCFKLHLAAWPTISSLSPFEVHRIINTTSNGTLGSGIIFRKEVLHRSFVPNGRGLDSPSKSNEGVSTRDEDSEEGNISNQQYLSGSYH